MDRMIASTRLAGLLTAQPAGAGPAYQTLAHQIRRLIADGRIPPGVRLPSERELTQALDISRTTVTRAYATLRDLGYLRSRQGSGSVTLLPESSARPAGALAPGADGGALDAIDLTCAAPTAPPGFASATEAALAALPGYLRDRGYQRLGLPELREAVADRYTARGLPTGPDQIMITSGALAGLAAALRALLGTGDRILMESPTYPNAIEAARRSGARPVALPLDPSGWDTTAVVATLRQTAPRAAYLIPDFQNPTGALMPDDQRREIGRALRATHTVPIIDETMADLTLDGGAAPRPMAASIPGAVTVGGVSKSYWGGLRIGWVRAAREEFAAVADARLSFDLSAPLVEQLITLQLVRRHEEIMATRRASIADSRDALVQALRSEVPDWSFRVPAGGLSLWIELPDQLSTALVAAAERRGVILPTGPQFAVEGGLERFLRIPYVDHAPDVLRSAVRTLAVAWQEARAGTVVRRRASGLVA